jgi:hypothetical protein
MLGRIPEDVVAANEALNVAVPPIAVAAPVCRNNGAAVICGNWPNGGSCTLCGRSSAL